MLPLREVFPSYLPHFYLGNLVCSHTSFELTTDGLCEMHTNCVRYGYRELVTFPFCFQSKTLKDNPCRGHYNELTSVLYHSSILHLDDILVGHSLRRPLSYKITDVSQVHATSIVMEKFVT